MGIALRALELGPPCSGRAGSRGAEPSLYLRRMARITEGAIASYGASQSGPSRFLRGLLSEEEQIQRKAAMDNLKEAARLNQQQLFDQSAKKLGATDLENGLLSLLKKISENPEQMGPYISSLPLWISLLPRFSNNSLKSCLAEWNKGDLLADKIREAISSRLLNAIKQNDAGAFAALTHGDSPDTVGRVLIDLLHSQPFDWKVLNSRDLWVPLFPKISREILSSIEAHLLVLREKASFFSNRAVRSDDRRFWDGEHLGLTHWLEFVRPEVVLEKTRASAKLLPDF